MSITKRIKENNSNPISKFEISQIEREGKDGIFSKKANHIK